jgi:ATP-dependent Clp protease ATP-binding subunit ClpA
VREGGGVASVTLSEAGVSFEAVWTNIEQSFPPSEGVAQDTPAFTRRAKKVLEMSLREALQLGHCYIGTEHILLGLLWEGNGNGCHVLRELGCNLDELRWGVVQLISGLDVTPLGEQGVVEIYRTRLYNGIRFVGRQVRPDLDDPTIDSRAFDIADRIAEYIREMWTADDLVPTPAD